jgi:hypothetical protein
MLESVFKDWCLITSLRCISYRWRFPSGLFLYAVVLNLGQGTGESWIHSQRSFQAEGKLLIRALTSILSNSIHHSN